MLVVIDILKPGLHGLNVNVMLSNTTFYDFFSYFLSGYFLSDAIDIMYKLQFLISVFVVLLSDLIMLSFCSFRMHRSSSISTSGLKSAITIILINIHRRLRGSPSPVLTATGFVSGKR